MENIETEGILNLVEARKFLGGISQTQMYKLVWSGDIKSLTIGNRKYVTKAELNRFMTEQLENVYQPQMGPTPEANMINMKKIKAFERISATDGVYPRSKSVRDRWNLVSINVLNIPKRLWIILRRSRINYVGEILEKDKSELMQIRNFGQKSMDRLLDSLKEKGIEVKW